MEVMAQEAVAVMAHSRQEETAVPPEHLAEMAAGDKAEAVRPSAEQFLAMLVSSEFKTARSLRTS